MTIDAHVRVVTMGGDVVDHAALLASALEQGGFAPEVDTYDYVTPGRLDRRTADLVRRKLAPVVPNEAVLFCPGLREYFLFGNHVSVQFSGYATWRDPPNLIVLPHPWGLASPTTDVAWRERPPLTVGFMGSTYRTSRVARLCARAPRAARKWLVEGGLVRSMARCATLEGLGLPVRYAPTFPRVQAIDAVEAAREDGVEVRVVDSHGFDRSADARAAFAANMLWSTYVLCPRGCENYSFRVYEALRFGRVPVIIDTDMILPDRDRLARLALLVDYDDIDRLMQAIVSDHARHDHHSFAARQSEALRYSAELLDEHWLPARLRAAIVAAKRART